MTLMGLSPDTFYCTLHPSMNGWRSPSILAESCPLGVSRTGGIRAGLETQFLGHSKFKRSSAFVKEFLTWMAGGLGSQWVGILKPCLSHG